MDDDLIYDAGDVELRAALGALRVHDVEPPEGFSGRLAAGLARDLRWRRPVRRVAHDRRAQVAAISVGGAILGATAVALLWRRNARRQAVA